MTATYSDVEMAVLALDAYNRGYLPGMDLPNGKPQTGCELPALRSAVDGSCFAPAATHQAVDLMGASEPRLP